MNTINTNNYDHICEIYDLYDSNLDYDLYEKTIISDHIKRVSLKIITLFNYYNYNRNNNGMIFFNTKKIE